MRHILLSLIVAAAALGAGAAAAAPTHPLDPLEEAEIAAAVEVIGATGRVDSRTRLASIALRPPPKQAVLAWAPGDPIPRRAQAVLRVRGEVVEAVVDLNAAALESWTVVPGVQSALLSSDWTVAWEAVRADPRWREAMRLRGYETYDDIFCEALSAGYFGRAEEEGRRLTRVICYDIADARTNVYARPIEGLVATVDVDAEAVTEVLDLGVVPVGRVAHDFDEAAAGDLRPPMRPVRIAAPEGVNFTLDGRLLRWDAWSMHLGFDQRFGPVLSLIAFEDAGARRPILHRAHVSEIFVPYMDPAESWAFRTYLDAGEFGLGVLTSPLVPGIDCPEEAAFLPAAMGAPNGRPYSVERVVCVFERDLAGPLWRHSEGLTGAEAGRRATELVVRSIATLAHYDYVIDWVFTRAGEIAVNIGATGIDAVKGVAVRSMADPGAAEATATGALVAPGLVAVNHDHFVSVRLDMDVDGPANRFVRQRLVSTAAAAPRRNYWRLEEDPMPREGAVSAAEGPQVWAVENPGRTTSLGRHPAYQIVTGGALSLLDPEGWPQRRGAFSGAHLWLTARREGEDFAAGAYPNQSPGGAGLPAYVDGESLDGADLVAWATVGFHHVTRPEDWPILSTLWRGLRLRPYGFFDRNPALGVRRD